MKQKVPLSDRLVNTSYPNYIRINHGLDAMGRIQSLTNLAPTVRP
jgi:hypothetical protein